MPQTTIRTAPRPKRVAMVALALCGLGLGMLAACSSPPGAATSTPPLTLVPKVDLDRYAGDWYVIGAIPTSFEDNAYNSKESYRLDPDGRMVTTFSFNEGGFTGPLKTYTSTGYILDKTTNAVWGQQYIWPIKADYRISHLSPDYQQVIVAREKRDYVWIMARTPTISDADYQRLVALVVREGYDAGKLRKMPQASGK